MDTKTIDTGIDAQELTLVDIEELRQALGAEAELSSAKEPAAAAPTSRATPSGRRLRIALRIRCRRSAYHQCRSSRSPSRRISSLCTT